MIAIGLSGIDDAAAGKQNNKKEGCQDCSQNKFFAGLLRDPDLPGSDILSFKL